MFFHCSQNLWLFSNYSIKGANDVFTFARFAAELMNEKFGDGYSVLKDIFAAMLEKESQERCGAGKQNVEYNPMLLELSHVLQIVNSQAYRALGHHLQPPAERHPT